MLDRCNPLHSGISSMGLPRRSSERRANYSRRTQCRWRFHDAVRMLSWRVCKHHTEWGARPIIYFQHQGLVEAGRKSVSGEHHRLNLGSSFKPERADGLWAKSTIFGVGEPPKSNDIVSFWWVQASGGSVVGNWAPFWLLQTWFMSHVISHNGYQSM